MEWSKNGIMEKKCLYCPRKKGDKISDKMDGNQIVASFKGMDFPLHPIKWQVFDIEYSYLF